MLKTKQIILVFVFIGLTFNSLAQQYLLKNEEIVFSFQTGNGKIMTLCKAKDNAYLVYRFGSNAKVELEYPSIKNKSSWQKFTYAFYLRGGGIQNEAMDLNELSFENEGIFYTIYQNYVARKNKYEIGIDIEDVNNHKTFHIIGRKQTQKGTLIDFRDNTLISKKDNLFDK